MRRIYFACGLFAITNELSVLGPLNTARNWIMYLFVHKFEILTASRSYKRGDSACLWNYVR